MQIYDKIYAFLGHWQEKKQPITNEPRQNFVYILYNIYIQLYMHKFTALVPKMACDTQIL